MRATRVLAVVNKAAGGRTDEFVAALDDRPDVELEAVPVPGPGDGARATAEAVAALAPEMVVAVGGDGTAGEVARGLVAAGAGAPPLLLAPAGTGNTNFRGVWDDRPWPEVLDAVFGERRHGVRRADLHHVDELGRATLLGVSAGVVPEALEVAATLPMTGRERLLAAAVQVLGEYRAWPGRFTVDDTVLVECDVFVAVVGGARYRAGMLEVLPGSMLDDGLLDVCVVSGEVSADDFGAAAISGTLATLPGVHTARGRRVLMERLDSPPMKLENDGECHPGPQTAYHVSAVPGPLLVVPDPAPDGFGADPVATEVPNAR